MDALRTRRPTTSALEVPATPGAEEPKEIRESKNTQPLELHFRVLLTEGGTQIHFQSRGCSTSSLGPSVETVFASSRTAVTIAPPAPPPRIPRAPLVDKSPGAARPCEHVQGKLLDASSDFV
jgi:hypothetical protein